MAKVSIFTAALCLFACQAFADQGISSTTLGEMGLSGMVILSDSDALAVRGKGWVPDFDDMNGKKPWVAIGGLSEVEIEGRHGEAGSINFYLAEGKHEAAGENFSTASKVIETIETHSYNGNVNVESMKTIKTYSAGGYSNASAF